MDFSRILITGATGSLGQALTRFLLDNTTSTIVVYSRDEMKQGAMRQSFGTDRVRYFLGDVRNLDRLRLAMMNVDLVVHAAALKHIDAGEYNPSEFVATNIGGTQNVIDACRDAMVRRAVLISTDKASSPVNLYGATKLVAEKLWIRANGYSPHGTEYVAVRYGNVAGSRGSVIPLWQQLLADGGQPSITSNQMTRFWISLDEAVHLAWFSANHAPRGTILVPCLPAYDIVDLAAAIFGRECVPHCSGVRPGEKLAEQLMTEDEMASSYSYFSDDSSYHYFSIPPSAPSWVVPNYKAETQGWNVYSTDEVRPYRSDLWDYRLSVEELRKLIANI